MQTEPWDHKGDYLQRERIAAGRGDPLDMEDKNTPTSAANPFARRGLARSPTQQTQQEQREQLQQSTLQQQFPPTGASKKPRLVVAKKLVDDLHEFVDKRNNVHKDIKELVAKIQLTIGSAMNEWDNLAKRVETAEAEIAATKNALAAMAQQLAELKTVPVNQNKPARGGSIPVPTQKRPRTSPEDGRPEGPKKVKDTPGRTKEAGPTHNGGAGSSETPWQVVVGKKEKKNPTKPSQRRTARVRRKGEALIVHAAKDSYFEVLRMMRMNPELEELGADVKRIRRTRNGDMILELKKDSANRSSSHKELAQKVMGDKVTVRAMCPEATIQCKDLDEVTTEDELATSLRDQCEVGEVEMTIRLRKGPSGTQIASIKLPVDAANKVLKIGKLKVGWSVCPLSVPERPEMCFRCHGFGHLSWNCKGPDRTKLCRRCGGDGHIARDCKRPAKCMICANDGTNDHVTGGPRCPAYKQALATKRKWK